MKKLNRNQSGFGAIESILLFVVVIAIAGVGYYVYKAKKNTNSTYNAAANTSTSTKPIVKPKAISTVDTYAGWKSYKSNLGGFTLKYPTDWEITGFQGANPPVDASGLNGNENVVRIQQQSESVSKTNNFGIDINLSSAAGVATPFDTYPNGTTQKLDNGFTLWSEKENETFATGTEKSTCPAIRVGTDSTYSIKLKNEKYLSVDGSFCWGQGMTTTYSYSQQVSSQEWLTAINVIKSISY